MKTMPTDVQGVLFDLDGTLLDSAIDLHAALVALCAEEGEPPPAFEPVREVVSRGSRAILERGFPNRDADQRLALVPRYLEIYQRDIANHTRPFEGIDELLALIESQGIKWGIVTNKPGFLTDQLVTYLGWAARAAAVVSGDTLPVKKPDPAPVHLACEQAGLDPSKCLFVGDDRRDVLAGAAAGMYTVAVAWGYLDGGNPHEWQADCVIDAPSQLTRMLRREQATA